MEKSHECPWPAGLLKPSLLHERSERRDASEHRRRILEVAQHLFTEHGVDVVSMHQIARAAGIGQGTLYRRYSHKGELCMDLLCERHERFMQEIAAMLATKATSPALEKLDGVLTHIIALLEEESALLGSAAVPDMRGVQYEDEGGSRRFTFQDSPWYRWLYSLVAGLLTEAVNQHELASLDVPYTADAILATFHPMFYRFQRQERGFSSERILQGLRHIYIEGMKPAVE
ncbi:MAG: TetR/AcrR family transcriptional regulator [Ktedonobacteraceae bacterium]|nr:TetR/AcrR family transcriptional regulator [Ktedonobacteraceae bacterium]